MSQPDKGRRRQDRMVPQAPTAQVATHRDVSTPSPTAVGEGRGEGTRRATTLPPIANTAPYHVSRHTGNDAEVIVIGGGPAGSTTAALLAARGHRVLLLDKARFPRHKACSEYINAAGVKLLAELGLSSEIAALGAHHMAAMRIHAPGGGSFLADFAAAEPGSHALGLSRYRLDALLLDRARAAGVEICEGAHVRDLVVEQGRVLGVETTINGSRQRLLAPLTVGADGRHSILSRSLGLDTAPRWPRRTGFVAHYRGVSGLDHHGEMHVTRHGYAGLAPLEDGLTNVALVISSAAVTKRSCPLEAFFTAGLAEIPAIAAHLANAERVGGIRGLGPMAHHARRVCGDGFLLVGDAASFLDPFTGDGIYEALHGALLAAPIASQALRAADPSARQLAPYRATRQQAFAARRQLGWLVQSFISTPPLLDYATSRLDRRPNLVVTLAAALAGLSPARAALSPLFLAQILRP